MVSKYNEENIEEIIASMDCKNKNDIFRVKGYLWAMSKDGRLTNDEYKSYLDKINKKCSIRPAEFDIDGHVIYK